MTTEQRIAQAARKHAQARFLLDETIRQARHEGMPLRAVAMAAGMSHEQVRRIAAG